MRQRTSKSSGGFRDHELAHPMGAFYDSAPASSARVSVNRAPGTKRRKLGGLWHNVADVALSASEKPFRI